MYLLVYWFVLLYTLKSLQSLPKNGVLLTLRARNQVSSSSISLSSANMTVCMETNGMNESDPMVEEGCLRFPLVFQLDHLLDLHKRSPSTKR